MAEYIKREDALDVVKRTGGDYVAAWTEIAHMPAADVAPVVRCAQCKRAKESKDAFDWDGKTPLCECAYMTQPNRWHEYCSWGKRKEAALRRKQDG